MKIIELYLLRGMSKKADLDMSKAIGQVGEGENYKSILGEFSPSAKPTSMLDLKSSPHLSDSILRESIGPFRPEGLFDNELKNLQFINAQLQPLQGEGPAPPGGAQPGAQPPGKVEGPPPGGEVKPPEMKGEIPGKVEPKGPAPGAGPRPPAAPGVPPRGPAPGGAPPAPGGMMPGQAVPPGGMGRMPEPKFIPIEESKRIFGEQVKRFGNNPITLLTRININEVLPQYQGTPLSRLAEINPFVKLALLRREGIITDDSLAFFGGDLFRIFGGGDERAQQMFEREVRNFVAYINYINHYLMRKEMEAVRLAQQDPRLLQRFGGPHGLFLNVLQNDYYFRHNLTQTWFRFIDQYTKIIDAQNAGLEWRNHIPKDGFFDWRYGPMKLEIPGTGKKEYWFTPQGRRVVERHD